MESPKSVTLANFTFNYNNFLSNRNHARTLYAMCLCTCVCVCTCLSVHVSVCVCVERQYSEGSYSLQYLLNHSLTFTLSKKGTTKQQTKPTFIE